MTTIIIDGKDFGTEMELHQLLAKWFAFPSYYGKNLDALWDCLRETAPNETILIWKDHELSKTKLAADFYSITGVLRDFEEFDRKFRLELA